MPEYQFSCEDCEIFWLKEGSMDKPPKTSKCPECGKRRDRDFTPTSVHFKGYGWETTMARAEKFAKEGMDKTEALEFLNKEIDYSKERMKTATQHYKRYYLNPDEGLKNGSMTKKSESDTKETVEKAKELNKIGKNLVKANKEDKK